MEAAVKCIMKQLEKYGKDFVMVVSYLGYMIMKEGCNVQFVQIASTKS